MATNITYIITLANGIIGVSILAMPFCFKQCGIVLSILMVILSSIISRLACHFLLKSAILSKRSTFEVLAFYAFGSAGKLFVEFGIIGFLLGSCIAFFVVIGDLAPAIVAKLFDLPSTDTLRSTILLSIGIFCILPLGLLRRIDSLSTVSIATVGFYVCLVLKIITEALPHILSGDWIKNIIFWRLAGIPQCLPIFSMALFCQTQIFEIYDNIPNASLETMNSVVTGAVNMCTAVYIFVGIFGYIAFSTLPYTGNVLMSFAPSLVTDVIKIGFVLSLAFSFPLAIFPCRASLYSLLFKRTQVHYELLSSNIPEFYFKYLTIFIVGISLIIGLLIPSIELVLGLIGSTIGVMICILFPAACFIYLTTKNTNERLLAQFMLFVGFLILILGTYANLYAMEETNSPAVVYNTMKPIFEPQHEILPLKIKESDNEKINLPDFKVPSIVLEEIKTKLEQNKIKFNKNKTLETKQKEFTNELVNIPNDISELKHEPPQPIEPEEINAVNEKAPEELIKPEAILEIVKPVVVSKEKAIKEEKEEVDQAAIQKEDREIAEEAKKEPTTALPVQKLYEKLKEQGKQQEILLQEAKEIVQGLKDLKAFNERKDNIKTVDNLAKPETIIEPNVKPNIPDSNEKKLEPEINVNADNIPKKEVPQEVQPKEEEHIAPKKENNVVDIVLNKQNLISMSKPVSNVNEVEKVAVNQIPLNVTNKKNEVESNNENVRQRDILSQADNIDREKREVNQLTVDAKSETCTNNTNNQNKDASISMSKAVEEKENML